MQSKSHILFLFLGCIVLENENVPRGDLVCLQIFLLLADWEACHAKVVYSEQCVIFDFVGRCNVKMVANLRFDLLDVL